MQNFDVIVVGGSMVGAAMALGLARQNYRVAVIDAAIPEPFEPGSAPDIRVSAISAASQALLDRLGVWTAIEAMRVCPYRRLSVWEQGARTDFTADDIPASHLGHIIENTLIQRALYEALLEYKNLTWFACSLDSLDEQAPGHVRLSDGSELIAAMVIGADGGQSKVRQQLGIGASGWQYHQQALAVSVKTDQPQQDITWQQFVPTGPMAFLPLYDGYASLVWYHQSEQIERLKALSDEALKAQIQASFPAQLADFEIVSRASFPLTRMHANDYVSANAVLVGDAAHTINPLAGQGLNLGFKDVDCLLEQLQDRGWLGDSALLNKALQAYQRKRKPDNLLMMSAMDVIYKTFSNDIPPIKHLRSLALSLAQRAGPLKRHVTRYAMGI